MFESTVFTLWPPVGLQWFGLNFAQNKIGDHLLNQELPKTNFYFSSYLIILHYSLLFFVVKIYSEHSLYINNKPLPFA